MSEVLQTERTVGSPRCLDRSDTQGEDGIGRPNGRSVPSADADRSRKETRGWSTHSRVTPSVAGRCPSDDGVVVADANTGEPVARVSSSGLDVDRMAAYGRRVGGPALAALSFHERAGALKALAQYLNERRQAYYELSQRTGATLADSKFDIDGGIGVLLAYASRAKRELPNDVVVIDGAVEQLGRGGRFVAQHLWVARPGVAVQINAFNFPVWGMLEKLAPAFIAGVASIVKPATQTAYLAELVVRDVISSGTLPEGTLQLAVRQRRRRARQPRGASDLVAFTGSATTAEAVRTHPVIVRAVRSLHG